MQLARTLFRAREEQGMDVVYCGLCDDVAAVRCGCCGTPLCRDHADSDCDSALRHCL